MANIFDYLTWRGDLDFSQSPFNPVDNIIFSQISYLPLDGIVPGPDEDNSVTIEQVAGIFRKGMQNKKSHLAKAIMYKSDPQLIEALGTSARFKNCRLCGYVNIIDTEKEVQFSACCIIPNDGSCFIVFRGTDFSLIGWKEDFNMSFCKEVPAQLEAASYLVKMAERIKGPLTICGHSKGGNLAVYAASHCSAKIRKRITGVYSNDAPGFHKDFFKTEGFKEIRDRIHSFVPQSSVVGMLLDHGNDYSVVKSTQVGLLQHELYSWEVIHNDMLRLDKTTLGSRFLDKTLREWIGSLDNEHREQFFNALYDILASSNAKSIPELESSWLPAAGRMIRSMGQIDDQTRTLINKSLKKLLSAAKNNFDILLPRPEDQKKSE
jgi:hypothetical protein